VTTAERLQVWRLLDAGHGKTSIARLTRLSRSTIYRVLAEDRPANASLPTEAQHDQVANIDNDRVYNFTLRNFEVAGRTIPRVLAVTKESVEQALGPFPRVLPGQPSPLLQRLRHPELAAIFIPGEKGHLDRWCRDAKGNRVRRFLFED
jgi:hypothetical protein